MTSGHYTSEQSYSKVTLQAEEELQFAKFLMDCAADAVFGVDALARFLYVNHAGCCMVGYSREQLLSMSMYDINPDFSVEVWSEYWKTIKQQGTLTFESLYQVKKGRSFPVEISASYLECHRREYCCIFVRDITKRKQAEAALQSTKEALECTVRERTAELRAANQQLCREIAEYKCTESALRQTEAEVRQALEQEKELGEVRARLVSMVSHEFRTPLNLISFSASLLKRHNHQWSEEKKLQYLARIQTAVEQLAQLMDEVLLIGRAEAGKLTFEPKTLDLNQFCCDLVAEAQLSDNGQHLVTFVSQGDCSTGCVDEKLLQPILTNLLSNAIKYSAIGSRVDLTLSCQDEKVIFQVKDEGIGIPAADRQRLFEPFSRGSNVGDRAGTGLGLAVVKKLLDIHGGQLSVDSEVGVGTTFTLWLPSCKVVEARASTPLLF